MAVGEPKYDGVPVTRSTGDLRLRRPLSQPTFDARFFAGTNMAATGYDNLPRSLRNTDCFIFYKDSPGLLPVLVHFSYSGFAGLDLRALFLVIRPRTEPPVPSYVTNID